MGDNRREAMRLVALIAAGIIVIGGFMASVARADSYLDQPGDYTYSGTGYSKWYYISVNASDTVNFTMTWSNSASYYICFDSPCGWTNYTGLNTENYSSNNAGYDMKTYLTNYIGGASPQSVTLTSAGSCILQFYIWSPSYINFKFNLTVTPAPSPAPVNLTPLQDNITALNDRLNTLYAWESSMEDEISNLSALEHYIAEKYTILNSTQSGQAVRLEELMTDLQSQSENLTEQIQNISATNNYTAFYNITNPAFNDSAIWSEIAIIEATPLVYTTNTTVNQTVVNQTNTTAVYPTTAVYNHTYLNKTIDKVDGFAPAFAGVVGGFIGGLIAAILMLQYPKKKHLRTVATTVSVPPPESLKDTIQSVRRLQSEGAEGEVDGQDDVWGL